ncbi:cysteine desulfurase family protein [Peribacillus sp. SCS-26]|uniref:cysteine desulfurase family protein n=1 Tax=Paraperibacillus marinus TaxID=3115295 RepID=UPI00390611F7
MIYFDNSATTKPFQDVIDSYVKVAQTFFGNPSSLHALGAQSEKLLMQGRRQMAELLGVKESEILFTSGGTEANNLAIKGAALKHAKRGRHIISTAIEHPSVKEALEQLRTEFGFEITYAGADEEGRVSADEIIHAIRPDTILVSVMHVNNETGTIQPIEEIGQRLKAFPKVLFHVDHVQGAGKVNLDIHHAGISLLSISSHKFHGLKGSGILYIRQGTAISPLFSGGSQEARLRSGTENVAGIVAMAKALRMCRQLNSETARLIGIRETIRAGLTAIQGVVINTPGDGIAPHILNFSVPGLKSEVLVHALEEKQIYMSTTSACSSKRKAVSGTVLAMTKDEIRAGSTLRVSLSFQNTLEEAEVFLTEIKSAIYKLQEVTR